MFGDGTTRSTHKYTAPPWNRETGPQLRPDALAQSPVAPAKRGDLGDRKHAAVPDTILDCRVGVDRALRHEAAFRCRIAMYDSA